MRVIVWLKGARGVACFEALLEAGRFVAALCLQPGSGTNWHAKASTLAKERGIPVLPAPDPNDSALLDTLRDLAPEAFVLAGYGPILKAEAIALPAKGCVNMHGGMLPQYRGSSPLNWALINGEREFGLSVIRVAPGVDTGDVLVERRFPVGPDSTIRDLHTVANAAFPEMLLEALRQMEAGTLQPRVQDEAEARYFPLRFPEDGFLLFDQHTAEAVHNRIRALTEPYPCAYTYCNGHRVRLLASRRHEMHFSGAPGRVYRKKDGALLVCASDRALWITDARLEDGTQLFNHVDRYQRLATAAGLMEMLLQNGGTPPHADR